MKKTLFILSFILLSHNLQLVHVVDNTIFSKEIIKTESKRKKITNSIIYNDEVTIDFNNLTGIYGNWYGKNAIVFDINNYENKIIDYATAIIYNYNFDPYFEIDLFYKNGESKIETYDVSENILNLIKTKMIHRSIDEKTNDKFENIISYKNNYYSRNAIINNNQNIETYSSYNYNSYLLSELTESSGYVKRYAEYIDFEFNSYYGKNDINGHISIFDDNSIVNIIPKSYFRTLGSNYYFGSEYGFYINTYKYENKEDIYQSNFIIITFENESGKYDLLEDNDNNYEGDDVFTFKLTPMINGFIKYDVLYDNVYDFEGGSNLCIDNIEFQYGTRNKDEPNIGDEDYVFENDNGKYSDNFKGKVVGVGKQCEKKNSVIYGISTAFSILSTLTPRESPLGLAIGLLSEFFSFVNSYEDYLLEQDKEIYQNQYNTILRDDLKIEYNFSINNAIDNLDTKVYSAIKNATKPYKGFKTNYLSSINNYDEQYPILLKNSEHFYLIEYIYSDLKNQMPCDQLTACNVSFDIKQDNSTTFNRNDITCVMTDKFTNSWQINLNPTYKLDKVSTNDIYEYQLGTKKNIHISSYNQYTYIKYVPKTTGEFIFTINENSKDNININLLSSNFITTRFSEIRTINETTTLYKCNLSQGLGYYFRFENLNDEYSSLNFYGGFYNGELNYNYYLGNDSYYDEWEFGMQIFDFTPQTTDRYLINTTNLEDYEYVDTYLEIYDSSFNRIAYSDNVVTPASISYTAEIETCLTGGETYYICTKPSTIRHNFEYYSVNAMRVRSISAEKNFMQYPNQTTYNIDLNSRNNHICLKFKPEIEGTYRFEVNTTNVKMALYSDPYYLLQEGTLDIANYPYIVKKLSKSSVYYLFIELNNTNSLNFNFYIGID